MYCYLNWSLFINIDTTLVLDIDMSFFLESNFYLLALNPLTHKISGVSLPTVYHAILTYKISSDNLVLNQLRIP